MIPWKYATVHPNRYDSVTYLLSPYHSVASKWHRMAESRRDLWRSSSSTQAGNLEVFDHGHLFWISPKETLHPLWAACANGWSPSERKSISSCSDSTFCLSACAHSFLSCPWTQLRRAWLHLFCSLPWGIYRHWWHSLSLLLFRMNLSSLFSLSSCSSPFIKFVFLCQTLSIISTSLLYWGVQNWSH